jgi:hypothetical protein
MMGRQDELEWLRDRGVQIDRKGRIIVSLPAVPDNEIDFDVEERDPSIAQLMRRDVDVRHAGSRGRRRRRYSTLTPTNLRRTRLPQPKQEVRIGRPLVGSEARVEVQTMIAEKTREILAKHQVTLADVFDDYARWLSHVF